MVAKDYSKVLVWPNPEDPKRIWGYYTLSMARIERAELNNRYERKAPKGIPVPVALIGYMGRDDGAPKGLGGALIIDAAMRVRRIESIAAWGLGLDAGNEELKVWYENQGFIAARSKPLFMYGPLSAFLPPA
jgi:hypothetical protein